LRATNIGYIFDKSADTVLSVGKEHRDQGLEISGRRQ